MSEDRMRTLRELLASLASALTEFDNCLYRQRDEARTELMLTVRMLDAFNTEQFGDNEHAY